MKLEQVAIQLYTLRDHCQTAADLAVTARKVREIGYTAVQASGLGPIPEEEIVAICKGEGLTICATHEKSLLILNETDKVIERLHKLGVNLTAYPFPVGLDFTDRAQIDTLVKALDAAGARMRAAGISLGYHNHGIEFVKVPGTNTTFLDYVYANTDPANLVGEPDTYWIHYGGGDCVEWCRKLSGRLPFIHLKDYMFTVQDKPHFTEIGNGTLPFDRIIPAAEEAGCQWFIVEQDTTPGDPFDSIRQSLDYIRTHLAGA
jgi:sugar phosphate isomerase/epimerase